MFTDALVPVMAVVASGSADTTSDVVTVAATIGIAAILVHNILRESLPGSESERSESIT